MKKTDTNPGAMLGLFKVLRKLFGCRNRTVEDDENDHEKEKWNVCENVETNTIEGGYIVKEKETSTHMETERDGVKGRKMGCCEYLLPLKYDTRPTLVLDLDQTLVYSSFETPRCYDFCVNIASIPSTMVYVKLRPHITEFIEVISLSYEIVIFTAAKRGYVQEVVSKIDRNGCISYILCRESCTLSEGRYIKDLSTLGRPLNNLVMVDDIPYSYRLQPKNGIHIPPYTGGDDDDALLELMRFLRKFSGNDLPKYVVLAPFRANVIG